METQKALDSTREEPFSSLFSLLQFARNVYETEEQMVRFFAVLGPLGGFENVQILDLFDRWDNLPLKLNLFEECYILRKYIFNMRC